MKITPAILFSTAYLGPIEYFTYIINCDSILIEKEEHYIKQTYRNRCVIYTANGVQSLTIPVIKVNGNRTKIKDIKISYAEKWQLIHWRAISSAYSNSPYFLYYRDELEQFYFEKHKYLLDYNNRLFETILKILEWDIEIKFTQLYYEKIEKGMVDLRNEINPKKELKIQFNPYTQVFAEKFGFVSNLSIIDLIFNLGPESNEYLLTILDR